MKIYFICFLCCLVITGCQFRITNDITTPTEVPTAIPATKFTAIITSTKTPSVSENLGRLKSELRIAFTDIDGNLYYWNGTAIKKIADEAFYFISLSPESDSIVYLHVSTDFDCYELSLVSSDGANKVNLIDAPEMMDMAPDCGGDPNKLWFSWLPEGDKFLLHWDSSPSIYRVDISTGKFEIIISVNENYDVSISPDNKNLALFFYNSIAVYDLENMTQLNRLDYESRCLELPCYLSHVWDQESKSLYLVLPSEGDPEDEPMITIWSLSTDGSAPEQVYNLFTNGNYLDVRISPNVEWVAYPIVLGSVGGNTVELHLARLDGGVDIDYYKGDGEFFNWSPDSKHFLYRDYRIYNIGSINEQDKVSIISVDKNAGQWIDNMHFTSKNMIIDIQGNMLELFPFDGLMRYKCFAIIK